MVRYGVFCVTTTRCVSAVPCGMWLTRPCRRGSSFKKELGRDPTPEQIARRIELPKRTVTLALESVVEPISLYEPVYNDGGDTICVLDQLGESGSEENWISAMSLRDTMNSLSPREKEDYGAALSLRQNTGGGGSGNRHQPGSGEPP